MVIFLAGVHGVGKTSLANRLAAELGIISVSSGQLIKQHIRAQTWSQDKTTTKISENQKALVSATRELEKVNPVILLDGHFVLLDRTGQIVAIEASVFVDLKLSAVIFIEDRPSVIKNRLETRDGVLWDIKQIDQLQRVEKNAAFAFCKNNDIPLLAIEPSEFDAPREYISLLMRKNLTKYLSKD